MLATRLSSHMQNDAHIINILQSIMNLVQILLSHLSINPASPVTAPADMYTHDTLTKQPLQMQVILRGTASLGRCALFARQANAHIKGLRRAKAATIILLTEL